MRRRTGAGRDALAPRPAVPSEQAHGPDVPADGDVSELGLLYGRTDVVMEKVTVEG